MYKSLSKLQTKTQYSSIHVVTWISPHCVGKVSEALIFQFFSPWFFQDDISSSGLADFLTLLLYSKSILGYFSWFTFRFSLFLGLPWITGWNWLQVSFRMGILCFSWFKGVFSLSLEMSKNLYPRLSMKLSTCKCACHPGKECIYQSRNKK